MGKNQPWRLCTSILHVQSGRGGVNKHDRDALSSPVCLKLCKQMHSVSPLRAIQWFTFKSQLSKILEGYHSNEEHH